MLNGRYKLCTESLLWCLHTSTFSWTVHCCMKHLCRTAASVALPTVTRKRLNNGCALSDKITFLYRGADKSLTRPGRKQATVTEDLDFHISYL